MPDLKKYAETTRAVILQSFADSLDDAARHLESPIEEAVFWALLDERDCTPAIHAIEGPLECPAGVPTGSFSGPWCAVVCSGCEYGDFFLSPQVPVKVDGREYRIDLALELRPYPCSQSPYSAVWIAIECDGHDYHERTKEQAKRDKQRDRDLQSAGWTVARFTGSEIYQSPKTVRDAVWKMLGAAIRRQDEEMDRRYRDQKRGGD